MNIKKILNIAKSVAVWIVVAIAVFMMVFTIISVTTFDRIDRNLFGFRAFIVLTDSMSATDFSAGDLVVVRSVDPSTLKEGDIISFQSVDPDSYGEIVTHKIRRVTELNGVPAFITYGTTTGSDDATPVTYSFVLGKYAFRIPGVGTFFHFLKTPMGYVICILIPFLSLIIMQGINSVKLFKKYKEEQMAELGLASQQKMDEIEEERRKLETERQQMQEILKKLQAQIAAKETAENQPVEQENPENKTENNTEE